MTLDVGRFAEIRGALGYATGLETLTYDGRLSTSLRIGDRDRLTLAVGARREVAPRVPSAAYGRVVNSAAVLVGEPDYFDYYRREGGYASVSASVVTTSSGHKDLIKGASSKVKRQAHAR